MNTNDFWIGNTGARALVLATSLLLAACGGGSDEETPPAADTTALGAQVEAIVRDRCVACHSVTPTMPGFASAPRGIRYDSAEQIRADAQRIYVNVVELQFMPYGNRTGMTMEEREVVRKWFEDEVK